MTKNNNLDSSSIKNKTLLTFSGSEFLKGFLVQNHDTCFVTALDTFGNCQRPVFSLGVSQHGHKITNLWIGRRSCKRIMEEKTLLSHKLCAFRCLLSRPHLRSLNQLKYFSEKLILSQKLHYFRAGEPFLTLFFISIALHCLLPSQILC